MSQKTIIDELKSARTEFDELRKKERELQGKIAELEKKQTEFIPDLEESALCGFSRWEVFLASDIKQRYGIEPKDFLPEAIRGQLQFFYLTKVYELTGDIADCHVDGLEMSLQQGRIVKEDDAEKIFYYAKEVVWLENKNVALRCLAASRGCWPKIYMIPNKDYLEEYFSEDTPENEHIKNVIDRITTSSPESCSSTYRATLTRKRNYARTLIEKIGDAAKLAHAIAVEGPKRGGNPWTEGEIRDLEEKLGVSIKGDCLKAFKAGMPAELVKKDAGARPITPHKESPDDVES